MFMKKKNFAQLCIIMLLLVITNVYAIEDNFKNKIWVQIEHPFYPVENLKIDIDFVVWNYANSTFEGELIYWVTGEKIRWEEMKINITVLSKNFTKITQSITPAAPGLYWTHAKLIDESGSTIYSTQFPFNVHSLGETAAIGTMIIGLLSFITYLKFKK
jgi:hypothetical protein